MSHTASASRAPESLLAMVTPADAERWLDNCLWSRQRKYREWHAVELGQAMTRGEFIEGSQIHFAKLNGKVHLINGQHTLNAIIKADVNIRLSVLTTLVDDEGDIAAMYSRHDRHLTRTLGDTYEANDLANLYSLSSAQIIVAGAALKSIICGLNSSNLASVTYDQRSSDERLRMFEKYGTQAKLFFDGISGAPTMVTKELRLASVMSVALITYKLFPEKAKQFWPQVAFSDGLSIGDPRKTLMNWLLCNPLKLSGRVAHAKVATRAWNFFAAGKSVNRLRPGNDAEIVALSALARDA